MDAWITRSRKGPVLGEIQNKTTNPTQMNFDQLSRLPAGLKKLNCSGIRGGKLVLIEAGPDFSAQETVGDFSAATEKALSSA